MFDVKLVVQVKLLPTAEQAEALESTLHQLNQAASQVSQLAFHTKTLGVHGLRRRVYGELKATGLGAQQAQHVIKKVVDAYTSLRGLIRNGRLTGRRRRRAESEPIIFRPKAAHPFDDRCLSWLHDARTVSIWTVRGRVKDITFTGSPDQLKALAAYRQGESDLLLRDGTWYLIATCEIPEARLETDPDGWIGVDRGIVNLATTSDGINYSGQKLTGYRRKMARVRAELQAKGTKSARRKLKRRAKRERRFATQTNHVIANEIVADAQRTGRGIAVEELAGIRDRVRLWPSQRATLSSWPFHQLGEFLAYKARRAGVAFVEVDPAYTSQMCPNRWCGHTARGNRPTRDSFRCGSCGFAGPADHIAALNVARRASAVWAFVNMPNEPAVASGLSASRAGHPDRTERRKPRASALGR
ncbi:RNA-guided endonuclease InsQ/TnpB family protein [Nonomuraea turcica]|uniref:RNA-guided endonuclease InsQ/TnpB family protein n=1 Tax=Nonomuraea sp. G32 TaxID=3067274 RepID=UPI00273CB10F|nr:transposase [Nonomuraea sp. G32]MDP4503299.1 transposase [Nonomuraea sp. G32]